MTTIFPHLPRAYRRMESFIRAQAFSCLFVAMPALGLAAAAPDRFAGVPVAQQPFVDKGEISGAVMLVADQDKVLHLSAVGVSDLATGRKLQTDDLFWIASMTKPINAAAVALLVDDGKLAFDDPVEKYVPEFKDLWVNAEQTPDRRVLVKIARPITLRDLLTHTSGLPFYPPGLADLYAKRNRTLAESILAEDFDQLRGGAGHLVERALLLQPDNPKALLYGAFGAMSRGETDRARERFTKMLALDPPPEIRAIVEKQLVALGGAAPASPHVSASGSAGEGTGAAKVAVHVTVAPSVASKVPAGAVLFIAARDPAQPGPPFAAKRLPATFPVDVELTPADAMMPSRAISAGQRLEIVARVALGGTPTATSGDPFGQVSYHVGKDGRLNIVIDRLAP